MNIETNEKLTLDEELIYYMNKYEYNLKKGNIALSNYYLKLAKKISSKIK